MNKTTLVAQIAEKAGLTHKQADAALAAFLDTVTESLKAGDKVQLIGFGSFEVRAREERKGRNPSTGKEIVVPACKVPCFKAGKSFKDEFNK